MHRAVPLKRLVFDRLDAGPPDVWRYKLEPLDNARGDWIQILTFDRPTDPLMTFEEVKGQWRVSEFAPHRDIRNWLVSHTRLMAFTKLTATYPDLGSP